MHVERSKIEIIWYYHDVLANLAVVTMPVGGPGTAFNPGVGVDWAPIADLPFFSIDVYTDRAVTIQVQIAHTVANMATMVTLTCAAALQHNSIYDLPPPHNKDGYLVVTGHWLRIRASNQTGGDADSFELVARAWK